jgi:ketosteroid isomerase-like protein
MDIHQWLAAFVGAWQRHDIDAVMDLFTEEVEYWETPFVRLADKKALRAEWQSVLTQHSITVDATVFAQSGGRYAIRETTTYIRDGERRESRGTYLLHLNEMGKCDYFYYASVAGS